MSLACALATSLQFLASAVKQQYTFTTENLRSGTANHPFVKVLNLNGPGNYVYIFCGSVIPGGVAFAYADTRWSGHTIALSMLPILYDYRVDPRLYPRADRGMLSRIETAERRLIARDFVERTPDLVLFDVGAKKRFFRTPGFDYLAFLKEDDTFRDLWAKYRYSEVGDVQDFRGRPFRVFVRKASSIDRSELGRLLHAKQQPKSTAWTRNPINLTSGISQIRSGFTHYWFHRRVSHMCLGFPAC